MEDNKKDVLPLEGEPLTAPQISEPVVNALAAALNKIETYVPTQYINDGPPDIDAEHLNHAEQAIMRVTNLANGAADAISALQSQVTQLNNNTDILENRINNTKRADDIEVFADGCEVGLTSFICHAETIGLPSSSYTSGAGLVLKRKQENVMVFLFSTNTTTALKCKNEGGWRDWAEYTKKSDLVAGTAKFPKTSVGTQEIIIDFPYEMRTVPVVLVSWKDTARIFDHMDGLVVTEIGKTRFKVASKRKIESYDWSFSYLAICR